MKVTIDVDGHSYEVHLKRTEKGLEAECEGTKVSAHPTSAGSRVQLDAKTTVDLPRDGIALINGKGHTYRISDLDPGTGEAGPGTNGLRPILAVMPGRLVKVLVDAGQAVSKGHPLFVLEAMKMQNELASPGDGIIREILCREGDLVEAGKVLARLGAA